ncbi:uncharacterized protein FTOL_08122 [Fusarium torulosum]|uniref:Uncharacterized protein n=1 Tax=Fusarium torulosum TaxID=33205 RepID=A0AAE8SJX2_9HYPO|nr:uncharacterized protein FTOL_08122 [Fusarium torulosum]
MSIKYCQLFVGKSHYIESSHKIENHLKSPLSEQSS